MFDRDVSLGCMIAYVLWTAAVVSMVVGTFYDSIAWQSWALLFGLGGGTATIRSYFCRTNRIVREALAVSSSGSEAAPVRRLH